MQLPSLLSKSMLSAMAGFSLSVVPAFTANVPNPLSGDLFLGFRASGGQGTSDTYLVKLGRDTDAAFAASGTLSLGSINQDLIAKYGAGWSSRADLFWGIFGRRNSGPAIETLYASRERVSIGTQAAAWGTLVYLERSNTGTRIDSVLNSEGGYRGRAATANSTVSTFQPNAGTDSSYNFQVATEGTTDFGSLSKWQSIEGNFGSGASSTVLDVFKIAGDGEAATTSTALFGTFTISNSGVVQFTKATTAPVDTDHDGFLDSEEAVAGTSPTDATDFFKVQSIVPGPGSVTVSFKSIAARTYTIYYSQDLSAGSWTLINTRTSGPYVDTDPVRTARPKGFYKVVVSNP